MPGEPGWVEATGERGCFPSPDEEGEGLYGVVTNIDREEVTARGAPVLSDGSWSSLIEAETGDRLTVHTWYPNGRESLPCTLTAP